MWQLAPRLYYFLGLQLKLLSPWLLHVGVCAVASSRVVVTWIL